MPFTYRSKYLHVQYWVWITQIPKADFTVPSAGHQNSLVVEPNKVAHWHSVLNRAKKIKDIGKVTQRAKAGYYVSDRIVLVGLQIPALDGLVAAREEHLRVVLFPLR